jgi:hypothetical protein
MRRAENRWRLAELLEAIPEDRWMRVADLSTMFDLPESDVEAYLRDHHPRLLRAGEDAARLTLAELGAIAARSNRAADLSRRAWLVRGSSAKVPEWLKDGFCSLPADRPLGGGGFVGPECSAKNRQWILVEGRLWIGGCGRLADGGRRLAEVGGAGGQ